MEAGERVGGHHSWHRCDIRASDAMAALGAPGRVPRADSREPIAESRP
jgi:hypothetical protein